MRDFCTHLELGLSVCVELVNFFELLPQQLVEHGERCRVFKKEGGSGERDGDVRYSFLSKHRFDTLLLSNAPSSPPLPGLLLLSNAPSSPPLPSFLLSFFSPL